jgi:hypothetical protein
MALRKEIKTFQQRMLTFNLNLYHRTLDKSFKYHFPNPRHTRGRRLRPEDKPADGFPR